MLTDSVYPRNGSAFKFAVLALLARDNALLSEKPPLDPTTTLKKIQGNRSSKDLMEDGAQRVVRVIDFLQALLPESCHEQLKCHIQSECLTLESSTETLGDTFKNAHIWFNHFIRVYTLDVDCLWHYIVRGAAIICANNHGGSDLLIPILFNNCLLKENVSAILVQVKNDPFYQANIISDTFERMNPFGISRVFSEELQSPRPVIRMVFALASGTPAIKFGYPASTHPTCSCEQNTQLKAQKNGSTPKFAAYDIWCAGTSSETFRVIQEHENYIYQELLIRTRDNYDPYSSGYGSVQDEAYRATARRAMDSGAQATLENHQRFVVDAMDPTIEPRYQRTAMNLATNKNQSSN